jgi:pimeloyl-ACP methyl ester carboxylesterase
VLVGAGVLAARRRAGARGVDSPAPEATPTPPGPLVGRESTVRTEDGVVLHVEEHGPTGAAATFVLAHGYTQASSLWAGQVRDLLAARDDLKVIVYDHRGHGRSGRTPGEAATLEQLGRDLAAVIEATAPSGPVLLGGHSMGGMTLMSFAEQHPDVVRDRVAGVAFVGTSSGGLASVTWGLPGPVGPLFTRLLHVFSPTFSAHDRATALGALAHLPALVLVGESDRLCPVAHSRSIAVALPEAELVVYPGAGHMVHLERRPEVSRQLLRLVERALPGYSASASRSASRDTPLTRSSSPKA